MRIKLPNQKIISDPLLGLIDVSDFLPMIDTKRFQSLGFKYQLGLAFLLFPAATHTRKQHCLGSFERTRRLARYWVDNGMINQKQAKIITAYALYHDIGHGPFSHIVEPLFNLMPESKKTTLRADDAMAINFVKELKKEVEEVGVDFGDLSEIFEHKNPLYKMVHDKNLGTEKFDYLTRDAFYTIQEVPGVDYLSKYIYFIDNQVVVDEKVIDQVKAIQDFYIMMSKHVYLRKKAAISQRLIQKMAYELVRDGMLVENIWQLTDFGLLGRFEISSNPIIKDYYNHLITGHMPKMAIELKYEQFVKFDDENRKDKSLHVFGLREDVLNKLLSHKSISDLASLAELEEKIASLINIPSSSIIVIPSLSHYRFIPEDTKIYGRDGQIVLLSDFYPSHFASMVEYGRSHHALRICAFPEYRDILSKNAEKVKDFLLELIKQF